MTHQSFTYTPWTSKNSTLCLWSLCWIRAHTERSSSLQACPGFYLLFTQASWSAHGESTARSFCISWACITRISWSLSSLTIAAWFSTIPIAFLTVFLALTSIEASAVCHENCHCFWQYLWIYRFSSLLFKLSWPPQQQTCPFSQLVLPQSSG